MLDLNNNKFTYREEKQQAKRGSMHNTYEKEFNKEHEKQIMRANLKAADDLRHYYKALEESRKYDYYKLKYNKKSGLFDVVERKNPMIFIYSYIAFGYTLLAIVISAMVFPVAFRTFFGF